MMKNKSTIAKLLANEDIHVVSKSMQTAYFNIKTRELGLPIWKDDITKDEEELMVCHEIGHALWTSMELLTKSSELNIPKDFINVLEDARIEKFVKSKYPGSVNLFNKGYAALASRDFFGIGDTDPQEQNLIDRINLYFKGIPNIKFTVAESVFVNRAATLQTEEQVINLAADLHQYMQDNPEQNDSPDNDDSDSDDNNDSGNSSESGEQSSNNKNTSESDESDDDDNDDSNNSNKPYTPESKTDKAANESVKDLSDMNAKEKVYGNIPKVKSENMIVDYKTIFKDLSDHFCKNDNKLTSKNVIMAQNYQAQQSQNLWIENSANEIKSYKNDSKKSVTYMVKEFEMKKSADQYARAATAKTGTLNMGKLHTYKYNDDLFKKVTTLPGATNHGMIIVVDWSGSMQNQLLGVFHQLLQLVWFCRRTQIPFEVLAFTQAYNRRVDDENRLKYVEPKYGDIAISDSTSLLNFFSSRMSSAEEESMTHYLWMIVKRLSNYYENFNLVGFPTEFPMRYNLSNTPLNESIIALMDYAPKFKKQTGVQKLNTIFLTDGEANNLEGVHDCWKHIPSKYHGPEDDEDDYVRSFSKDNLIVDPINNKQYEVNAIYGTWSELSRNLTETLLKALKNRVSDMNVIGFFIAGTGRRGNIGHSEWYRILGLETTVDTINKARNAIKKDKVLVIKKSHGYDGYYIMPGGEQLEINTDLGLDDTLIGASKSKLKNAFAKSAKNRIQSRVMLNKFVEMVS